MSRNLLILLVAGLLLVFMLPTPRKPLGSDDLNEVCHGPALTTVEARNDAMEQGYAIHPIHQCIEKASFDAIETQRVAWEKERDERVEQERGEIGARGGNSFAKARHGFATQVTDPARPTSPPPQPPPHWFVRSDYVNPQNHTLLGYISPDPADGRRHPAILWLGGGDTNTLGDFWTSGPDENDQSARAFREAGVVMAFVTLRGGNGHRSRREFFLGEVDDVLAAARQLAQIRYVDPDRIYLGGHSTGGTLALLTAAMGKNFRGVFAFGPVASAAHYGQDLVPVDFDRLAPDELKLRSPIHWLAGIGQPTWIIEGAQSPGNIGELDALCAATRNPQVRCVRVPQLDHFSVLRPATLAIAVQIAAGDEIQLTPEGLAR